MNSPMITASKKSKPLVPSLTELPVYIFFHKNPFEIEGEGEIDSEFISDVQKSILFYF